MSLGSPTSEVAPNERQCLNIKHNTYIYVKSKTAASFQVKKKSPLKELSKCTKLLALVKLYFLFYLKRKNLPISNSSYGALLKLHYIARQSSSFVGKDVFYLKKKNLKCLTKISEVFLCQSPIEGGKKYLKLFFYQFCYIVGAQCNASNWLLSAYKGICSTIFV